MLRVSFKVRSGPSRFLPESGAVRLSLRGYASQASATASASGGGKTKPRGGFKTFRRLLMVGMATSGAYVGSALYAKQNPRFAEQFKVYAPGGRAFLEKVHQHDNNIWLALADVSIQSYDHLEYTARFIAEQFEALYTMLRYNTWDPKDLESKAEGKVKANGVHPTAPLPPASTKSQSQGSAPSPATEAVNTGARDAPSAEVPITGPWSTYSDKAHETIPVNVEIPPLETDDKLLKDISSALLDLIGTLNKARLASSNLKPIHTIAQGLADLQERLLSVKNAQHNAVKEAIAKKTEEFKQALKEFEQSANKAIKLREEELARAHGTELDQQAKQAQERLLEELKAQKTMLERRFNRFVRARVDEERGARLAQMDRLVVQYTQLVGLIREHANNAESFQELSRVSAMIDALANVVHGETRTTPFLDELNALARSVQKASSDRSQNGTVDPYKATKAVVESISTDAAKAGVASQNELEDRFAYVRREVRHVSLVPEDGSFASQVQSAVLSKLLFEKEGLVEGEDVESILARTHYYLQRHNLDHATRELNQLRGWAKKLASDWIVEARRRLELEQALQVARAEDILAKIARA
ncbi:hypothetical protein EV182_004520 [Spiromyces aspiralis]|uniref:Uncharacterized protein n=1 Tax=Spiromyces aspiralis TaxID=68401 RepID=A0ACC1HBI0_9FUNG|nr:hypothetical protein EV182_004520 [Spiromyces aspiralis]